jgi:hypothetical protein
MLSDHYRKDVFCSDLSTNSEIGNDEIWAKVFNSNIGDITIIVDNIHFKVIGVDDNQPFLLYTGFNPPPPWDKGKIDRSWICNYWSQH